MRSAITKKANQDEQQNQTTWKTFFNYIQNFISSFCLKKKTNLLTKSKECQIKTENKPTYLFFFRKYGPINY